MKSRVFADRKPLIGLEAYCADAKMYVEVPFDNEDEDSKTDTILKESTKATARALGNLSV